MLIAAIIFIILHGLVHLLYMGQALRAFELQPGMKWPDESRFFSFLEVNMRRKLAVICCILSAAGFLAGAIALLAGISCRQFILFTTAGFSSLCFLMFWNGKMKRLDNQGGVGILINLAVVLLAILIL